MWYRAWYLTVLCSVGILQACTDALLVNTTIWLLKNELRLDQQLVSQDCSMTLDMIYSYGYHHNYQIYITLYDRVYRISILKKLN